MSDDEVPVFEPMSLSDGPTMYPHNVEVEWAVVDLRKHEPGMSNEVVAFHIPDTLPKARSAYCNDAVFNEAVDVYAEENDQSPEAVLRENTAMRLTVEKRLLSAEGFEDAESPSVTSGVRQRDNVAVLADDAEDVQTQRFTDVESAKEAYVEGEIDEMELEAELEKVMDDD